jgi:hypothetical protein
MIPMVNTILKWEKELEMKRQATPVHREGSRAIELAPLPCFPCERIAEKSLAGPVLSNCVKTREPACH